MKLQASLISRTVPREPLHAYAQKLAREIEPGQHIQTTRGQWMQVVQKTASPDGLHYSVVMDGERKSFSLMHLAALGLMSKPMRRLASFIQIAAAGDALLGVYINKAIEEAGYPIDPKMDWDRYLRRMFQSVKAVTEDESLFDDAIITLIVQELYGRQILSPRSPYAHFDPDHAGLDPAKPVAEKVSQFLTMMFYRNKGWIQAYVRNALGAGIRGEEGKRPVESLDTPVRGDDAENRDLVYEPGEENRDIESMESDDQIESFFAAFRQHIEDTNPATSAALLNAITDGFSGHLTRAEIRAAVVNNPELKTENGNKVNDSTFNFLLAKWVRKLREFAADPRYGWLDSDLGQMVGERGAEKDTRKRELRSKRETGRAGIASLRLAAIAPEVEPQPQQPGVAPPPPQAQASPNVQQQLNAQPSANNLNTAQPAHGTSILPQQQQQQKQPPRHINPSEVPGVLVSASLEDGMNKTKTAANLKYAAMRHYAANEPGEVGEALRQMRISFLRLASNLYNFANHMDLAPEPKTISVLDKVAARNKFARGLKKYAEENPAAIESALNDFYTKLNTAVTDFESMAEGLGVTLSQPEDDDTDMFEEPTPDEGLPEPGKELAAPPAPPAAPVTRTPAAPVA